MDKKKKKSFNAEIDDLLDGLNLPSDEEIKDETKRYKLSQAGKGKEKTIETRRKIGDGNKGKKLPPLSKEACAKKSEIHKLTYVNGRVPGMAGKTQSLQSRALISSSNMGKKKSEEARANISKGKKGKSHGGNFKAVLTPYGIFASIKEAGKYEEHITGKKFNPNRYTKLLGDINSGYKRISGEEYTKLTGKEI